jgi:hypothetical protein
LFRLETLHLQENVFTGTIPESVQQLQSIGKIYNGVLSAFSIHPAKTHYLFSSDVAEILFMSSNKFSGSIPPGFKRLSRTLRGLYLSDNEFQGLIPTDLCQFGGLGK